MANLSEYEKLLEHLKSKDPEKRKQAKTKLMTCVREAGLAYDQEKNKKVRNIYRSTTDDPYGVVDEKEIKTKTSIFLETLEKELEIGKANIIEAYAKKGRSALMGFNPFASGPTTRVNSFATFLKNQLGSSKDAKSTLLEVFHAVKAGRNETEKLIEREQVGKLFMEQNHAYFNRITYRKFAEYRLQGKENLEEFKNNISNIVDFTKQNKLDDALNVINTLGQKVKGSHSQAFVKLMQERVTDLKAEASPQINQAKKNKVFKDRFAAQKPASAKKLPNSPDNHESSSDRYKDFSF